MSHTATKLYSSSKESVQVGLAHCATCKKQVLHLLLCYDILEWKKFLVKRLLGLYNSRFLPIASLFSCKGYNKVCPDDTGQEVNSGSERIFSPDVQQLIRICPLRRGCLKLLPPNRTNARSKPTSRCWAQTLARTCWRDAYGKSHRITASLAYLYL